MLSLIHTYLSSNSDWDDFTYSVGLQMVSKMISMCDSNGLCIEKDWGGRIGIWDKFLPFPPSTAPSVIHLNTFF